MSELCLKDQTVLTFKDIEGVPREIAKINSQELLPVCLRRECTMENVDKWLKSRCIPDNRDGLKEIINTFGTDWLTDKNCASLSDQYWIKRRTETWKKVNYFTSLYSLDAGDLAFMPWTINKRKFSAGPDLTTNGVVKKRWRQYPEDKTSYLLKAASPDSKQTPLGEVLVSVMAETLGIIDCVKYDLCIEGVTLCSKCDNFITQDTELVPAYHIYYDEPRPDNRTVFEHLIKMCELYDIPNAEEYIKGVIFIDALCGNEDRNLNNIGFIRDVNTLKFIGPAPLYDSGNAFWSSASLKDNMIKSKFFGDKTCERIFNEYRKKININALKKETGYKSIIYHYPYISEVKKENLIDAIDKRNNRLLNYKSLDSKGIDYR